MLEDLTDPAAALDAAVLAGVVVETGDRLSAAHPLIAAAAVELLPPARRAELYRRLAEASSNPERYAHFAALAAGPGPDEAVAAALDAAADAAHARAANAAAAQFAAQAVTFTPNRTHDALVRRRIRAAELLFLAGEMERSLEHLEALDIDAARDRRPRAGAAAADRHDRAWSAATPPPPPSSPAPSTPPGQIPAGERWSWRWPPTSCTASAAGGAPPPPRRSAAPRPPARRPLPGAAPGPRSTC